MPWFRGRIVIVPSAGIINIVIVVSLRRVKKVHTMV